MNKELNISLPRPLSKDSEMDLLLEGKRYILTYQRLDREVQLEYFGSYTEAMSRYLTLLDSPNN
jgi:hypothetical protein